jgi:hypothetical protein
MSTTSKAAKAMSASKAAIAARAARSKMREGHRNRSHGGVSAMAIKAVTEPSKTNIKLNGSPTEPKGSLYVGVYETPFPFHLKAVEPVYKNNPRGWKIGCEKIGHDYFADGVGTQIIEVSNVVWPGGQPTRVALWRRTWVDPDGRKFSRKPNPIELTSVSAVLSMLADAERVYKVRRPRPQLRLVEDTGTLVACAGVPT